MTTLIRNSSWALLSKLVSVVSQGVSFIIIVRVLGPMNYGVYATCLSMALIVMHFVSPGITNIIVKEGARNKNNAIAYFNYGIKSVIAWALVVSFMMVPVSIFVFDSTSYVLIFIIVVITEFGVSRLSDVCYSYLQSSDNIKHVAVYQSIYSLIRTFLVAGLLFLDSVDLVLFSSVLLVFSILFFSFLLSQIKGEVHSCGDINTRGIYKEGMLFAVGVTSKNITTNTDKIMLTRMISPDATGLYAVANRVVNLSFVPVQAILFSSYAEFFRRGQEGIRSALVFAKTFAIYPFLYALFIAIVLYFVAPLVPYFIGDEYQGAVEYIRFFCMLPVLMVITNICSDVLTGSGYQGHRASIQLFVAALNVVINLVLIPIYGVGGAIVATISSEVILCVMIVLTLCYLIRNES